MDLKSDGNRRDVAAGLATLVVVIVFWNPLLWPGHIYSSGDLTSLFWSQRVHLFRSIAEGVVPLWNRHTWLGAPFLASMQPGVFDPTSWIGMMVGGDPTALLRGFNLQRICLLMILAGNMFALGRGGFGLSRGAAAFAALVASCCGFMWCHFDHVNQISAMVWYPLILLGALRTVLGHRRFTWSLMTPAVALQAFAGHPQHLAYGAVVTVLMVGIALILTRLAAREWVRCIATIGFAHALGAMLAAPQLLPGIELSRLSERAVDAANYASAYSLEPRALIRLVWPLAFGAFPNYTVEGHFSEWGIYLGQTTLALALVGTLAAVSLHGSVMDAHNRDRWALTIALVALVVFSLLWALGSHTPLLGIATHLAPPLAKFRAPSRMLFHFSLAMCLLAGLGLDGAIAALRQRGWTERRLGVATGLIIALTFVDLWAASRMEYFRQPGWAEFAERVSPAVSRIVESDPNPRLFRLVEGDSDYFLDHRPMALRRRLMRIQPNTGLLWGITDIDGYTEGLLPTARWRDLTGTLHRNLHQYSVDAKALGLLGVRWVLTESSVLPIDPARFEHILDFSYPEDGLVRTLSLWENPFVLPMVVPRSALDSVSDPAALIGLWERGLLERPGSFGEAIRVVREDAPWPGAEELGALSSRWTSPNAIEVEINPAFSGEAVLIQGSYPGWVTWAESGERTPLVSLNGAWSAWDVPLGTEWMTLRFEPASYRLGVFIGSFGLLCLSLAWVRPAGGIAGRGRSPGPPQEPEFDRGTR